MFDGRPSSAGSIKYSADVDIQFHPHYPPSKVRLNFTRLNGADVVLGTVFLVLNGIGLDFASNTIRFPEVSAHLRHELNNGSPSPESEASVHRKVNMEAFRNEDRRGTHPYRGGKTYNLRFKGRQEAENPNLIKMSSPRERSKLTREVNSNTELSLTEKGTGVTKWFRTTVLTVPTFQKSHGH